jgi:curved DNA-binding protein
MDYKDYYTIMGVARTATQDEIKRAYRKLAKKFHPDVSKEKNAEARFKEMQEAYEVLKDPEKRAAYDQLGSNYRAGQEFRPPPDWGRNFEFTSGNSGSDAGNAEFSDFFSQMFGARSPFGNARGGARRPGGFAAPGQDHVAQIEISVIDAYKGTTQTIQLQTPQVTEDGHVVTQPKTLRVSVPAGVIEGQQIRLAGQGSSGTGGERAGDLYLEIHLRPHALYHVDGRDVNITLPIAPWEAALGSPVQVPTLGGPVEMNIPAGARAGQKMRLKGRGFPGSKPGDQYVTLQIATPPADSPRARELYEQMKQDLTFNPRSDIEALAETTP